MHYLAGTLTDVRANAEAAEALRFPLASHVGGAAAMLARFQFALHTGDRAHVRAGVRIARRVSREAGPAVRRHAAWMLALAADDPLEAVRWLNDDELPYAVPFLPSDPAYHVQVVRIALAAEERALAGRAVAVAEEIERANPAVALLEGLASHARGLLHDDPLQLERAVALLEHSQRPLPHASALEDMGRALGDAERLNQAHECYLATGATEDAARVARRLRRFGIRQAPVPRRAATGWESLTESELRVVRLVGAGSTNRDTARRLSVSPHTVSSHLRHAFAKLKINSRVELARVLHEQDVAAPAG
jgi:DNA-binding CsgD family transcriptional regulator